MRRNARPVLSVTAREAPLVAGIVLGCILLWLWGEAFVSAGHPRGNGWWDGLVTGWEMLHGGYTPEDDWRRHLHPLLLATWGERIGYTTAGIYLSSVSLYLLVIGAGVGGRALAGPWAGALAAISVPVVQINAEAARWVTFYPLLAAATGLAVGLGCCLARWPSLGLALATGLATALAWALDTRGVFVLPLVVALLAVGMTRAKPGRRRWVLPAMLALGLLPASVSHEQVDSRIVPMGHQLVRQREVAKRWVEISRDAELVDACRDFVPPKSFPLLGSCSREVLRYNLGKEYRRAGAFPLWLTLGCLLLALLPGRSGWRSSAAAGVALGGVAVLLLWQGLRIPTPPRYLLQFAAPIAMIVPVGLVRLARTALPDRVARWAAPVTAGIGVIYLLWVGNPAQEYRTTSHLSADLALLHHGIDEVETRVGPQDRLFNCGKNRVHVALLPRVFHAPPPSLRHTDLGRCQAWMEAPELGEGESWLLTDREDTPERRGIRGWELTAEHTVNGQSMKLWRWTGGDQSNSTKIGTDVSSM